MILRRALICLAAGLALAGSPSPAGACTSFAAYGGDRPWYGMNFDYAATEITLALQPYGSTTIFLGGFGIDGQIASINDRGLFANYQMLYYSSPQQFTTAGATIALGSLCSYAIANLGTVAEVTSTIGSRRVIRSWNRDLHSLFADPLGHAIVVDPFGTYSGITPARDGFLVMTNLPNYQFLNRDYTAVQGAGADRYVTAYEYVRDHLSTFGYADAMETLRRTVQGSGPYPTQVSFVFDPTGPWVRRVRVVW